MARGESRVKRLMGSWRVVSVDGPDILLCVFERSHDCFKSALAIPAMCGVKQWYVSVELDSVTIMSRDAIEI